MAKMADRRKEVLVAFGERKRAVSFQTSDDLEKEKKALFEATRDVFSDVICGREGQPEQGMILQIKSEKWNGEFIDVHGSMVVPDGSVLQLSQDAGEVSSTVSTIIR